MARAPPESSRSRQADNHDLEEKVNSTLTVEVCFCCDSFCFKVDLAERSGVVVQQEFVLWMEDLDRPRSKRGRFTKGKTTSRTKPALLALREKRHRSPSPDSGGSSDDDTGSPTAGPPCKIRSEFPLVGRRAVHLQTLSDQLSKCQNFSCEGKLLLEDCTGEQRYGLGSVLKIPCRSCSLVNKVDTDTRVDSSGKRGPLPFTSNRKIALGKFSRLFLVNFVMRNCTEKSTILKECAQHQIKKLHLL